MRVRIQHETVYTYSAPARLGPHVIRLRPSVHTRTQVLSYNLSFEPEGEIHWQHDPWGNRIARLTFPAVRAATCLRLLVDAAFDIRPVNPFDFYVDDRCVTVPFQYPDGLERELAPFLERPEPGSELERFVTEHPAQGGVVGYLVELARTVARRTRYVLRHEPGIQTSEQTLTRGEGSCRDSARLLVDVLRSHGLAARFASGYLIQLTDEGNIPDLVRGVSRDEVDLHAWAEAYIPGAGWIGLDGTSGLLCTEGHVPLACTATPELAAPVSGTSSLPAVDFDVRMEIARLGHEPRPARPYTAKAWEAIRNAGQTVDQALEQDAIRLTSGGEPTWISRDHRDLPEWRTQALGPTKTELGLRFLDALTRRLAPGALGLLGRGKLYPGESLPRWILHILWRRDGEPIWRDPGRLDLSLPSPHGDRELDAALDLARSLTGSLARRLGVREYVHAAFEDPWHAIMEEQNLPEDVDPLSVNVDDPENRRRLAHLLARGLRREVGFVLPLERRDGAWVSSRWRFRRARLFLVPGDSPLGLRLPLDRIVSGTKPGDDGEDGHPIRTAVCVEPRDGKLHVFLPPVRSGSDFLELVRAVENTTEDMDLSVLVEGYGPPADPALQSCSIAPDPGVLELNLPPSESFDAHLALFARVSEAANQAGLCCDRFQLDGRELGTGGGNHITLGGPTAVESPFLRRPVLLASLVRYLQNHPALSYLFSGLFIGPTCQAPRPDEARHESLYELELALSTIESAREPLEPHIVQRLLRDLLVDLTGNTHRAEICIDKLHDVGHPAGQLGLVELRAFEMPPHEHMVSVQVLLTRALVARFARSPYREGLVRWGSELHDRFMLPHHIWADLKDVVMDLQRFGLPLELEWFRPFLDHRLPILGLLQLEDIQLELRMALEPWPTLGEETSAAAVSRTVDSSLERLQVKVTGLTEGRHVVAVNGLRLALRPTGTAAEQVGGVRYRAWQPPGALLPGLPVHHPLRFDVVDLWGQRSLGACTYHVWHPEGRSFDRSPLTAFEAAARRAQRFTREGHAPWPVKLAETEPHPDQPFCLDLRRYPGPLTRSRREAP